MNKIDRYKILIRHLIHNGVISSQKDLARMMGYTNESAFSQIINQKVQEPKDFISRLQTIYPTVNIDWLLFGEGDMIVRPQQEINGDHNTQVAGNANNVNSSSTIEKAIDEISAHRKLLSKSQEQIDRLLSIIENMSRGLGGE